MIDDENAVEMVDLMLQHGGEEPVRLDLARLAFRIEVFDLDLRRPLDFAVKFRDRQAAFLIGRLLR